MTSTSGLSIAHLHHGVAIHGDGTAPEVVSWVANHCGKLPLINADPPYGNIVSQTWDSTQMDDQDFCSWMMGWTKAWATTLHPGGAFYVWGGVGKPGFRPFFRYLSEVESKTPLSLANLITWAKKRAYGVQHNYLFTREECAYLMLGDIKHPRRFHVPLLDKERGYEGYNEKYPAKSKFLRRTNVWSDITEIMRGKLHPTQKARRVMEIPIQVHTDPGEWVVDPFAGSGTTGIAAASLGRRYVVIEKDGVEYAKMLRNLEEAERSLAKSS